MKILIVSPEVSPYAQTDSLADVASSLGKSLRKLGHDARLILPCYKDVDNNGYSLRKGRKSVEVTIDGQIQKGLLRQTMMEGVPVYFIENRDFFHRDGLYGNGRGEYQDNAQRFAFFCHAVLQLLRRMDFRPDILHLHSWQTGLIPVLLRTTLKSDPFYSQMSTLFTVHDIEKAGIFPSALMKNLNLFQSEKETNGLGIGNQISFLRGGLAYADLINTVSETFCHELQTPETGGDLAPLLRQRSDVFHGVLNGIDTKSWDPSLDMNLSLPYNVQNLNGKKGNKRALQKEMDLELEPLIPIIGIVSPLTHNRGADIIVDTWDQLMQRKIQLVIAGRCEDQLKPFFSQAVSQHPGRARIILSDDQGVARRIFAGSDIFLLPSRHEPFGPEQIIALRYGSVPVVHRTGGLNDTVIDVDEQSRQANGFVFDQPASQAMLHALDRALKAYENRRQWLKLVKRGMTEDFTWLSSSEKYVELYRKAMAYRPV